MPEEAGYLPEERSYEPEERNYLPLERGYLPEESGYLLVQSGYMAHFNSGNYVLPAMPIGNVRTSLMHFQTRFSVWKTIST